MQARGQVLVVDDDPAIRALVAKIVERTGMTVDTATDGEDAIARLRANEYVVVVLDMMMPRVDGFGVIDFLKDRPHPRPTVIVISAGEPGAFRNLDPSVVHSIVRKPFDINVLGDLIDAAVRSAEPGSRKRDEGGNLIDFPRH